MVRDRGHVELALGRRGRVARAAQVTSQPPTGLAPKLDPGGLRPDEEDLAARPAHLDLPEVPGAEKARLARGKPPDLHLVVAHRDLEGEPALLVRVQLSNGMPSCLAKGRLRAAGTDRHQLVAQDRGHSVAVGNRRGHLA